MRPSIRVAKLLLALAATACGSRSGLPNPGSDAGADSGEPDALCGDFPPIPPTQPSSCTFFSTPSKAPVLAAIADRDLVVLTAQGTFESLFHFGYATGSVTQRRVTSRGDHLGAMLVGLSKTQKLQVELVSIRVDGTLLAHHQESFAVDNAAGMFGVEGNAAGTFAFSASAGGVGGTWVALPQGSLLGPFDGVAVPYGGMSSPRVEPDEHARFVVLPVGTSSTADVEWLDPCAKTKVAALSTQGGRGVGWGRKLFGVSYAGQLATETADGVTTLPHASLGSQFDFWDFEPPFALFAVPPFPPTTSLVANLLIVNADTLTDQVASLAYPGLSPVPANAWLSSVGDSNNPAGFGLDSSGRVTMFLSDAAGTTRLYATADGTSWTPIGLPVVYDPTFAASHSIKFAEAAGTYVIQSAAPGGGAMWHVARPSAGVVVPFAGRGRVAHDGRCVAALVSNNQLDVLDATSGQLTQIPLPFAVDSSDWVSTWIPGEDAALPAY